MIGIILSIFVAFTKASMQVVGKLFTNTEKNNINEYTLAYGGRLFMGLLSLSLCFYIDFSLLDTKLIIALIITSSINAFTTIGVLKSVKYGDISLVGPLGSITIPCLYITSYYINGENPNIYGFLGVFSIFIGTYFLGVGSHKGIFSPIKAIYQDIGARYMLLSSFLWSISAPFDKIGIEKIGVINWILLSSIMIALLMTPVIYICRRQSFSELFKKTSIKKISQYSLIGGAILGLQFLALKYTLVIYVVSIKRASGIFSVILGYFFFQEKNIGWKLFATSLMIVGVAIITLFGNI